MTADTTYFVDTTAATETDDPTPDCTSSFGRGVWYAFTPSFNGVVTKQPMVPYVTPRTDTTPTQQQQNPRGAAPNSNSPVGQQSPK